MTPDELRTLLHYDPSSGQFTWRAKRNGQRRSRLAGYLADDGYIVIRVHRILYKAHRLAWLYVHGRWPDGHIDHANGVRSDNSIANLREATHSQNLHNSVRPKSNTSGYKGVNWSKVDGKWRARITVQGQQYELGLFDSPADAHAAYCEAARAHLGEFSGVS